MTEDFIFDKIDAVEEAWKGKEAAKELHLDIYSYLELKKALGYEDEDKNIERYHGYKIVICAEEDSCIKLY